MASSATDLSARDPFIVGRLDSGPGPGGRQGGRNDAQPDTRHLILYTAAEEFARRGYTATTTRQIAAAVGIQQPSLFHHFPTKQAILDVLLGISLERINKVLKDLVARPEDPAVRMMTYLFLDTAHILSCPFNLLGLHADNVLALEDFQYWRNELDALHGGIRKLITQGTACGSFIAVDAELGQWMVTGSIYAAMRVHRGRAMARPQRKAWQIARLTTRSFLAEPAELDTYQAQASRLVRKLVGRLPAQSASAEVAESEGEES
jgi:AcrR family transcriptional regulator